MSHHGSHNGVSKPLTDALTPVIALLATGPEERHLQPMSAWAFGHPRERVIDLLLTAVSRTRENTLRKVAKGVKDFANRRIDKAIYATGWDGNVVITADRAGTYEVRTER